MKSASAVPNRQKLKKRSSQLIQITRRFSKENVNNSENKNRQNIINERPNKPILIENISNHSASQESNRNSDSLLDNETVVSSKTKPRKISRDISLKEESNAAKNTISSKIIRSWNKKGNMRESANFMIDQLK